MSQQSISHSVHTTRAAVCRCLPPGLLAALLAAAPACSFSAHHGGDGTGGAGGAADAGRGGSDRPIVTYDGSIVDEELSADGFNCGLASFGLDTVPPDLLIVQDRSGTMTNTLSGHTDNKWEETTAAINEVVQQTQSSIRWGLKLFAMPIAGSTTKCGVEEGATVELADNNATAIAAALEANPASDNSATPTRFAIQKAVTYLQGLSDGNPRYILLSTDGLPNCAEGIGGDNNDPDQAEAIQAVADAKAAGIPVFVVGIATTKSNAHSTLNSMADAGGYARSDATARYYPVSGTAELVSALTEIGGQIATCSFKLATPPPAPDNVAVDTETARIPRDVSHANGWDYTDGSMTAIQIYGSWCDGVKSGTTKKVQAIFGCAGQVIP